MQNKIIDENLVENVISGSIKHQKEFVEIAEKIIYGALSSFHQLDNSDRDDLLQNIFLKLFEKNKRRMKMWNKKAKFSTYLYMITTNHALDYLQSKYFKQKLVNDNDANFDLVKNSQKPNESSRLIDKMTIDMSREKLRPVEKQIVDLYYYDGYKEKEIAEKLKISINTVSSIKNRAIKKIRKDIVQEFWV